MPGAEKQYAVLTGDVVGSSRFEPADLKALMQRLRKGSEAFSRAFPGVVRGQLDVFSGDGWQMLLQDWRKALRAALFMRAVVRSNEQLKADTRVAIGLGRIDQETLNPKRVSEATGQAFERSGRALKELKKPSRMTWAGPGEKSPETSQQGRLLVGALRLLDEMISRWKPKQAQSMALALLGRQQAHIASELGVAQPTVSHSLKSAGWKGIAAFLAEVET